MNKLVILAKTLRLPNLLLLALVQFLVSHYILKDYSIQLLILISSATISIALAGYLLNDVFDLAIDKANNKLKLINENNKNWALLYSVFLFSIGLIFGFLSSQLSAASFFKYYISAALALVLYALILSKLKFIGNFVVAGLIVLAIFLAFFQQKNNVSFQNIGNGFILIFYGGLAFILNWIREVIKDFEDIEGDTLAHRLSLPILLGSKFSKLMLASILFGCMILFLFLSYQSLSSITPLIYYLTILTITSFAFFKLIQAKQKNDFASLSTLMKIVMFLGILLPIFV